MYYVCNYKVYKFTLSIQFGYFFVFSNKSKSKPITAGFSKIKIKPN